MRSETPSPDKEASRIDARQERLLDIKGLKTYFYTEDGVARAVDDVSLSVRRGETLGIVGESGCGKSVTALSIMRLIPEPPGRIVSGEIQYAGYGDLLKLSEPDIRHIRGNQISMIFQEPMTSLNPVFRVGNQIAETVKLHQRVSRREASDRAVEMLEQVGIPSPARRARDYPHQLSGGMRQRAMIAMALSCNPSLLIADEPTTALDVTIQAQVLNLMNTLRTEFKAAIMFITHDLGVIAHTADDVVVMYLGRIVEKASVDDIFLKPKHPYTRGLMNSIPSLTTTKEKRLIPIEGVVPDILQAGEGCGFESRCPKKMEQCTRLSPPLTEVAPEHFAACWLNTDEDEGGA